MGEARRDDKPEVIMEELKAALKNFFEKIDTQNEFGLTLDESLELVLEGQDLYLWKDKIDDYVFHIQIYFESAAHYNLGKVSGFSAQEIEELKSILQLSPYVQMEVKKTDLRNAEYIELSNGLRIPINQGCKN